MVSYFFMLHLLVDYSPKTKFRARGLPGEAMTNTKFQNPISK
jgi:hypothetical protein